MAKISGKAGEVDTGASVDGIKSWTLDYTVGTGDTTDFGDSGVSTHVTTITTWSGTFEGYKDGVPQTLAGSVTLTLKESQTANQLWTGTASITGVHSNTAHDGVVTYSYDFLGNGALTVPLA